MCGDGYCVWGEATVCVVMVTVCVVMATVCGVMATVWCSVRIMAILMQQKKLQLSF